MQKYFLLPLIGILLFSLTTIADDDENEILDSHLSANCRQNTGGNLIQPKTNIECQVYGRGAKAYEVVLGGHLLSGYLDPHTNYQNFATVKKEVGYKPRWAVYLIDRFGNRIFVASN